MCVKTVINVQLKNSVIKEINRLTALVTSYNHQLSVA